MAAVLICTLGLVVLLSPLASANCLNNCNANGLCNSNSTCSCFSEWNGTDCSLRKASLVAVCVIVSARPSSLRRCCCLSACSCSL